MGIDAWARGSLAAGLIAIAWLAAPPPIAAGGGSGAATTADCAGIPPVHHRMYGISGARDEDGNENTIWGMEQTYNDGVRWFETDAQALLSASDQAAKLAGRHHGGRHGAIVLFHDWTLDRTTNDTGLIRSRTYEQLPLTSAGHPIPTLNQAFRWLSEHPGTHLLIEIKMRLPWSRVNRMLEQYGFAGTNRVIFDTAKVDAEKHEIALEAAQRLNATTGVKTWPPDKPATWLARFGTGVRLNYNQAVNFGADVKAAGLRHRFAKNANGWDGNPPGEQWAALVKTGVYRYIITERSRDYLEWCARQQS